MNDPIVMDQTVIDGLPEYSLSEPTGVLFGKRWKARPRTADGEQLDGSRWVLREFVYAPEIPGHIRTTERPIIVYDHEQHGDATAPAGAQHDADEEFKRRTMLRRHEDDRDGDRGRLMNFVSFLVRAVDEQPTATQIAGVFSQLHSVEEAFDHYDSRTIEREQELQRSPRPSGIPPSRNPAVIEKG